MSTEEDFTAETAENAEAINGLTRSIIGAAIAVHEELGPGLLESVYQSCLAFELAHRNIPFEREVDLPVVYRGNRLDCGYRMDFIVDRRVIVEVKAIDSVAPIHKAQLLSYLRIADLRAGLLINFHAKLLTDGVTRLVNNL